LLGGVVLGGLGVVAAMSCGPRADPLEEVDERRADTTPQEVAQWAGELERRGSPWFAFPDPPGDGPLEVAFLALGHESYRLELRARPSSGRVTLGIRGVDKQVGGGGWLAFAEGTWHPHEALPAARRAGASPFAGSVARIAWSCLGARLRSGNDGVARLTFLEDGSGLSAFHVAYGEPEVWTKNYARVVARDADLPRGTLRGQIPSTPRLAPLPPSARYAVRVRVRARDGRALAGAVVRLKGHAHTQALTDAQGEAEVTFLGSEAPRAQVLCAGAIGHRNGERVVFSDDAVPGWVAGRTAAQPLDVVLEPMPRGDSTAYAWHPASPDADPESLMACGTCHKWHFDEWHGSRHARSADNGHVEFEHKRMLAQTPEAPDDCRACHQPGEAAVSGEGGWTPLGSKASVHCDLCHKVERLGDLRESGVWGALVLARPAPGASERPGGIHQVFGPLPDATYAFMGASWNPLFEASHYCAGCHQGGGRWREGALAKLDTFEEWRGWAAARGPKAAQSCQDCHMPAASTRADDGRPVAQVAWDSVHRTPEQVHSHRFRGTEAAFAAAALDVVVEQQTEGERVVARVRVTNVGAGHKIPTGTWSKHVLVGVWARQGGRWLRQVGGDRAWTVDGEAPAEALAVGDWRNPGGLVLGVREKEARSGALRQPDLWLAWKADEVVDERLAPGASREARCEFERQGAERVEVFVRVVHRRGELGTGPAHTPWVPRPYDEPPEMLWLELVR
jgi:hypothetical protein